MQTWKNCLGMSSFSRSDHSSFEFHMVINRLVKYRKTTILDETEENIKDLRHLGPDHSWFKLLHAVSGKQSSCKPKLAGHYDFYQLKKKKFSVHQTWVGNCDLFCSLLAKGAITCVTLGKHLCPSCSSLPCCPIELMLRICGKEGCSTVLLSKLQGNKENWQFLFNNSTQKWKTGGL